MDIEFLNESSMEDSFIYKSFNASNALIDKMVKYLKTGVALDSSYIEEQYMQMKKIPISPLSQKVVQAYDAKEIELLYSRDVKIGNSIPFIIRRNGQGRVVATIFIASFAIITKEGYLSIPVKQLYALMESAYVALQMQIYPQKVQRNLALMKLCSEAYLQMYMKILNRLYAVSTDKTLADKVSYVIRRFFIERVWEYPTEATVLAYAKTDLKFITSLDLDLLEQGYSNSQIKNIDNLIAYLRTLSPRLAELNTRYFIEQFVGTFHGSSIMALDYLPYVFFVIINVMLSSFLISQQALNDIIKNINGMQRFYVELAKTI